MAPRRPRLPARPVAIPCAGLCGQRPRAGGSSAAPCGGSVVRSRVWRHSENRRSDSRPSNAFKSRARFARKRPPPRGLRPSPHSSPPHTRIAEGLEKQQAGEGNPSPGLCSAAAGGKGNGQGNEPAFAVTREAWMRPPPPDHRQASGWGVLGVAQNAPTMVGVCPMPESGLTNLKLLPLPAT
jgi:hypothetical protein